MLSAVQNAIKAGLTVHRSVAGVSAVYRRPSTDDSLSIDCVVFGSSDLTRGAVGIDQRAGNINVRSEDASFAASDEWRDLFTDPQRGDEITVTRGSRSDTYRAVPFGPDKEIWRYADAGESQIRVHLERIRTS